MTCILPAQVYVIVEVLFGWTSYLYRVVPQVKFNWAGVGSGAISLAGLVFLGQFMGTWLWRNLAVTAGIVPARWKWSWTLGGAAIVVLLFASGIAAVGMTHQTAWLARSDRPLFGYKTRESANRVKCASEMKTLGQAMLHYASEHQGSMPDTLESMVSEDLPPENFVCPSGSSDKAEGQTPAELERQLRPEFNHNSYVYLGRGKMTPLPDDLPIVAEPLLNHSGQGMNVLFGNLDTRWLTPAEAVQVLRRTRD
jgi:hypothetical protein